MNVNDIREMSAGREMDALIAEKIMGCTVTVNEHGVPFCMCEGYAHSEYSEYSDFFPSLDCYSKNIEAAWQVVEKLDPFDFELERDDKKKWDCLIWMRGMDEYHAVGSYHAETAPLAICRAALTAVIGEK